MRFTLRAVLAYLDDILEPSDAEDIRKKIDESDFAKALVDRLKQGVRHPRLGSPPLIGRGLALDPNTIASYLDNELDPDKVAEFEKICLESDVHLAEVASAHEILAWVLEKPVDVDPGSRQRMYQLARQVEETGSHGTAAAAVGASSFDTMANEVKSPAPSERFTAIETPSSFAAATQPTSPSDDEPHKHVKPEVPDYLREGAQPRRWPLMATLGTAIALAAAILYFAAPDGLRQQVAGLFGGKQADVALASPDAPPALPDEEPSKKPAGEWADPPAIGDAAVVDPATADADDSSDLAAPPKPLTLPSDAASVPPPDSDATTPPLPGDAIPGESAPGDMVDDDPNDKRLKRPINPSGEEPTKEPAVAAIPAESAPPGEIEKPASAIDKPAVDIAANAGTEMGRYLTDAQVMLRYREGDADKSGPWKRLAPKEGLAAGDRVLTLPAFRPTVALANNVNLQTTGPAMFTLVGLDENAIPIVQIEYGRFTLFTVARANNQLHLKLADRDVVLTFGDSQSTMALDARGVVPVGTDPETATAQVAVELYATSGSLTWTEAGNDHTLKAPEHVAISPGGIPLPPGGALPEWATKDTTSEIDRQAARVLEKELAVERPVSLTLKELCINRRREVRSLAIRSSACIGEFDAFVTALNDEEQKAAWSAQIATLRESLSRGPEVAKQVRLAFEKERGNQAKDLYRMLWGYTPDQLAGGAADVLVASLDDESLDYRVVGFSTLQDITGLSLLYRPEYPPVRRRTAVTTWKEKLRTGKIVYVK